YDAMPSDYVSMIVTDYGMIGVLSAELICPTVLRRMIFRFKITV
ncbi:hypothetical protein A2U01_0023748, partial [Trifolium medium]|nr:hypothetical protein [Trifolium medium]